MLLSFCSFKYFVCTLGIVPGVSLSGGGDSSFSFWKCHDKKTKCFWNEKNLWVCHAKTLLAKASVYCRHCTAAFKNLGGICGAGKAKYNWLDLSGQVHFDPSSEPALLQYHKTSLTFCGGWFLTYFYQFKEEVSFFILVGFARKRVLFRTKHSIKKLIPLWETGKICEQSHEW